MSSSINLHRTGLALGGLLGIVHLGWSLLVALRWAQPLLDLIFRLHMIEPAYTVSEFSLVHAIGLVLLTTAFGYVLGALFGLIWKKASS